MTKTTELDALASAFATLPERDSLCPIGRVLAEASPQARANMQAAMDADRKVVSNQWIAEQLRKAGVVTSKDTVSDHRNRRCRCT